MPNRKTPAAQKPHSPPPTGKGKAVKIPDDLYEDLLRLQGVYPGMSLMDIAALKLRKGLEADREILEKLRAMQRTPPKE